MARTTMSEPTADDGRSTSIERAVDVLDGLAAAGHPLGVAELASAAGRSRPQTARMLHELEEAALVHRSGRGRGYRLDWALRARADELVRARLLREGGATLESLADSTGFASFLVELRGAGAVAVLERGTADSWAGRSYPLYCDDAGTALLVDASRAELDGVFAASDFAPLGPNSPRSIDEFERRLLETRARGFAVADEETKPGRAAIAAPVRDFTGHVIAAVQILGDRGPILEAVEAHGELVRSKAAELSARLGWRLEGGTA